MGAIAATGPTCEKVASMLDATMVSGAARSTFPSVQAGRNDRQRSFIISVDFMVLP